VQILDLCDGNTTQHVDNYGTASRLAPTAQTTGCSGHVPVQHIFGKTPLRVIWWTTHARSGIYRAQLQQLQRPVAPLHTLFQLSRFRYGLNETLFLPRKVCTRLQGNLTARLCCAKSKEASQESITDSAPTRQYMSKTPSNSERTFCGELYKAEYLSARGFRRTPDHSEVALCDSALGNREGVANTIPLSPIGFS